MTAPLDIISFWRDVLAPYVPLLQQDSWSAWKAALRAMFGLVITGSDLDLYRRCTGREEPPETPPREGWFIVGRRGGKSFIMALTAIYLATVKQYRLAVGERGVLMVIASDRRQARVVRRYIGALLKAVPMLRQLVEHETRDLIRLSNGIDVEIHTASHRTVRGYSIVGAILDEIAYWPVGDAADPDREIVAALRPAMATTDGLLIGISTPYARQGSLYEAHKRNFGESGDVLVWSCDTATMNPAIDRAVIERAFEQDETSAWSEYGKDGEIRFRADIESYVSHAAIEASIVPDRLELPPLVGTHYHGFLDFSGGSGQDSATLAIAHGEDRAGQRVVALDCVRERRPPFSPEQVCRDFAAELKRYSITTATADRFAGDFPVEQLRKHGVTLQSSEKVKSAIYRELLPLLNSGALELLDIPRLHAQLGGLERRTARGGRDSIDHGPGGHDDLINAASGSLVLAAQERQQGYWLGGSFDTSEDPQPDEPVVYVEGANSARVTKADVAAFLEMGDGREAELPLEEQYRLTAAWLLQRWQLLRANL